MFYSITGKLVLLEAQDTAYNVGVETPGGVAYEMKTTFTTANRCPKLSETVTLFTHLAVRESAVDLFGFYDIEERRCFRMLVSVSGVGPKFALSVLSTISPSELALCVASGDSKTLVRCKGIGNKTAQRIVLELKDKVSNESVVQGVKSAPMDAAGTGNISEAISALMVLGFTRSEAASAVAGNDESVTAEELIKIGLKKLAK